MSRMCVCAIFAMLLITASASGEVAAFKARTSISDWAVEWTIDQADVDACQASLGCCLSAGTITPTVDTGRVVFTKLKETGSGCMVYDIILTIAGATAEDLNPNSAAATPTGQVTLTTNMPAFEHTLPESPLILEVMDRSDLNPPQYIIYLPSVMQDYVGGKGLNLLRIIDKPASDSGSGGSGAPSENPSTSTDQTNQQTNNNSETTSAKSLIVFAIGSVIALLL